MICCSIGNWKIAIYRFVVGGYVRKCVVLRISIGLSVVALAAGISRRVLSVVQVIIITIIAIYPCSLRRSGHPLSSF